MVGSTLPSTPVTFGTARRFMPRPLLRSLFSGFQKTRWKPISGTELPRLLRLFRIWAPRRTSPLRNPSLAYLHTVQQATNQRADILWPLVAATLPEPATAESLGHGGYTRFMQKLRTNPLPRRGPNTREYTSTRRLDARGLFIASHCARFRCRIIAEESRQ